jgi:hypothetical protein
MSALVTVRITCDTPGCGAFKVLETDSKTTARRMLANLGWKVVLRANTTSSHARSYGDLCDGCPLGHNREAWRYAAAQEAPQRLTATALLGNALPRRTVKEKTT